MRGEGEVLRVVVVRDRWRGTEEGPGRRRRRLLMRRAAEAAPEGVGGIMTGSFGDRGGGEGAISLVGRVCCMQKSRLLLAVPYSMPLSACLLELMAVSYAIASQKNTCFTYLLILPAHPSSTSGFIKKIQSFQVQRRGSGLAFGSVAGPLGSTPCSPQIFWTKRGVLHLTGHPALLKCQAAPTNQAPRQVAGISLLFHGRAL